MADLCMGSVPILAVVLTTAYFIGGAISVPWVNFFVSVNVSAYYTARIPLDIGLLRCFSEICTDYARFVQQFNGDGTPENRLLRESTADPVHVYGEYPFQPQAEAEIAAFEAPFKHASIVMILAMVVALLCGLVSLGHIALYSYREGRIFVQFRTQAYIFWIISVTLFLGNAMYCVLTYSALNGGFYYFQGVYLMNIVSMFNAMVAISCSYFETQCDLGYRYLIINDQSDGTVQLASVPSAPAYHD
jgi:hypothetical protein